MRPSASLFVTVAMVCGLVTVVPHDGHARPKPEPGKLTVKFDDRRERLVLRWEGRIMAPMARKFTDAFDRWLPRARNGVLLNLNSGGGKISEMARVIRILQDVRETHRFDTLVRNGQQCGSACVPIFLQGRRRIAGYASAWLFHEVTKTRIGENGRPHRIAKPRLTDAFLQRYFHRAGVSRDWIEDTRLKIEGANYWMTGIELFNARARIVTRLIGNHLRRRLAKSAPRRRLNNEMNRAPVNLGDQPLR